MRIEMTKNLRTSLWLSVALSCLAMLVVLFLSEKDRARAYASGDENAAASLGERPSAAVPKISPPASPSTEQRIHILLRNLATPSGRVNPRAIRAVREVGSLAIPAILEEMQQGDDAFQEALIICLGEIGDPAGLDPLLGRLSRPGDPLKDAVVRSVSALISEETAAGVIGLMRAEAPDVRIAALRVLAKVQTSDVIHSAIGVLLEDPSPEARVAAIDLLETAQDDAVPGALLLSLDDTDKTVRLRAVHILGRRPCEGAREALKARFTEDPDVEVRRAAAEALARL
ncbi:MAG: HEAT repeat domain-containing protein [Planctomycetes bacterium]|nr:HEAT repeat domain-containing protein [Planctomycetota bacterium]